MGYGMQRCALLNDPHVRAAMYQYVYLNPNGQVLCTFFMTISGIREMTLRRSNLKNRRLLQKSTHGHTELAQLWWNPLLDHKADHRYIVII